jgi:hypothetical protein
VYSVFYLWVLDICVSFCAGEIRIGRVKLKEVTSKILKKTSTLFFSNLTLSPIPGKIKREEIYRNIAPELHLLEPTYPVYETPEEFYASRRSNSVRKFKIYRKGERPNTPPEQAEMELF